MIKIAIRILCFVLLFPITTFAAVNAPLFKEGTDYQLIHPTTAITPPPPNKIQVTEFFSYGCPWCYKFEPYLEKWLVTKPAYVNFQRVPVVFEARWDIYARAYYTAKDLGVENKITPAIFKAIQDQNQTLATPESVEAFFIAQGVKKDDFDSAFNFSPGIDAQMMRGETSMKAYAIFEVPTLVINGKYKTSIRMTKGDNVKFLQIVDYLIAQEKKNLK